MDTTLLLGRWEIVSFEGRGQLTHAKNWGAYTFRPTGELVITRYFKGVPKDYCQDNYYKTVDNDVLLFESGRWSFMVKHCSDNSLILINPQRSLIYNCERVEAPVLV